MMLGQGLFLKLDLVGWFNGLVNGFPHFLLNHQSFEASIYFSINFDGCFELIIRTSIESGPSLVLVGKISDGTPMV